MPINRTYFSALKIHVMTAKSPFIFIANDLFKLPSINSRRIIPLAITIDTLCDHKT